MKAKDKAQNLTAHQRKGRRVQNRRIEKIVAFEEPGERLKRLWLLEVLKAKLEGALLEKASLALREADCRKYCRNGHSLLPVRHTYYKTLPYFYPACRILKYTSPSLLVMAKPSHTCRLHLEQVEALEQALLSKQKRKNTRFIRCENEKISFTIEKQ